MYTIDDPLISVLRAIRLGKTQRKGCTGMARPSNKTPDEKVQAVLTVLAGRRTAAEVARELDVSEQSLHNWKRAFLEAGRAAFERSSSPPSSREAELEIENEELKAALGEAYLKLRLTEPGLGAAPVLTEGRPESAWSPSNIAS